MPITVRQAFEGSMTGGGVGRQSKSRATGNLAWSGEDWRGGYLGAGFMSDFT
jgi:hypothetical protein